MSREQPARGKIVVFLVLTFAFIAYLVWRRRGELTWPGPAAAPPTAWPVASPILR